MRKLLIVLTTSVLSLTSAACITVVSVKDPVRLDGKKRIIEVDEQLYVVDVEAHTVRAIDAREAAELADD